MHSTPPLSPPGLLVLGWLVVLVRGCRLDHVFGIVVRASCLHQLLALPPPPPLQPPHPTWETVTWPKKHTEYSAPKKFSLGYTRTRGGGVTW